MNTFVRGVRLGAGTVALGWGAYQMMQGRRHMMAAAAISAGASMLFPDVAERRPVGLMGGMNMLLGPWLGRIAGRVLKNA